MRIGALAAFLLSVGAQGFLLHAAPKMRVEPPDCLDDSTRLYVHGAYVSMHRVDNPIRHEGKRFTTLSGWSRGPEDVVEFDPSRFFWSHKWMLRMAVDSTRGMPVGRRTFTFYPGEYRGGYGHSEEERAREAIRDQVVFFFEPYDDEWVLVGAYSRGEWEKVNTRCAELMRSLELDE